MAEHAETTEDDPHLYDDDPRGDPRLGSQVGGGSPSESKLSGTPTMAETTERVP